LSSGNLTRSVDEFIISVREEFSIVLSAGDFSRLHESGAPLTPSGEFDLGELAAWLVGRILKKH